MHINFDSIPLFLAETEDYRHGEYARGAGFEDSEGSWYGSGSWESNMLKSLHGDDKLVPEANAMVDQITAQIEIPSHRWIASVEGAFPVVSDYLANSPTPMRTRRRIVNESSPVRLYISTTCSAGITAKQQRNRGVAVLALLLVLQRMRPVELYFLSETHGTKDGNVIMTIRLESQPLDLAVACHCLTHISFARRFCYNLSKKHGFNGSWPDKYQHHHEWNEPTNPKSPYSVWLREHIGMNPQDLYIKPTHLYQTIVNEPLKWINEVLSEISKGAN